MAEHADESDTTSDDVAENHAKASETDWGQVKDRFIGILAGLVRWVCLIFALILVLHIVFTVADANKENGIVEFVSSWADRLTLGFQDLFLSKPDDDPKANVLVNFGIAAVVWLIISAVGASLIRRVGGLTK